MTDNLHSMAPNDEELLAYALDEEPLPREAREHLEHCPTCQQRLAQYTQANTFLTSQLYRSQCPTAAELTDYCAPTSLNLLSGDERMSLASHISTCPLCTAEVTTIRHESASVDLFPEPEHLLFSPRAALKRIIASLQPARPQLVTRSGETGGQTGWPKHYKADSLDLSLHLSRGSNGEILLLGLFTSANSDVSVDAFEGSTAELYSAPGPFTTQEDQTRKNGRIPSPLMTAKVDDLGNLVFKSVPVGEYVMVVRLPDTEIVIEGINIEHS